MSIIERKKREKEEMRRTILDAAKEIFLEKGFRSASIRNIAEKIEYSPGTIYLYFDDKDAIFHALHEDGFQRMLAMMQPLQHVKSHRCWHPLSLLPLHWLPEQETHCRYILQS